MNASNNELGVYRKVGSVITAGYNFPEHWARRIRKELDPYFRPMWANQLWASPNDGRVWVGFHILARYVPHPKAQHEVLSNLLLPGRTVHGAEYKTPIVLARSLDGLTDDERDAGVLPYYEAFTERNFDEMRWAAWKLRNETFEERNRKRAAFDRALEQKKAKANAADLAYRESNEAFRLKKDLGLADMVGFGG